MKNLLAIFLYPVPHYTRWGMYPQAAFIVACLFWFQYRPEWGTLGPGVAIAFLAVAAVIMAVRADYLKHSEAIVWILIAFVLFWIEMRSISEDRFNHDAQQAEIRTREQEHFEKMLAEQRKDVADIVKGIQKLPDLIVARNKALQRVKETTKLAPDNVKRRAAILAANILTFLADQEYKHTNDSAVNSYYLQHYAPEASSIYEELTKQGVKLPAVVPSRCTDATNTFLMRKCADDLVMYAEKVHD
ncbi:MAG: hypothetical protein WCF26_15190 [Candidatus Sulfotelmatobacter sp.]